MGEIKVKKYGIIHAYAQCQECEWIDGIEIEQENRIGKLRNRIYSHIRKTGHKVHLETGNSTEYSKEQKND